MSQHHMVVRLYNIYDVRSLGDGVIELVIPAQSVSKQDSAVLDKLFPNTTKAIEDALATEALIQCQKQTTPSLTTE